MEELDEIVEYRGFELDRFQKEAIKALQEGDSVLVAAPTGTGKTVIADWIVERAMQENRSVVYTAPIKALSNQKFRDYCALFGEENVGLITGDLVIRRQAPCKVMTTEILRNMLLCEDHISNLAAVIIDEIHFLDDKERGTTWEEVLIYLPEDVQIVGLSATLSNIKQFAQWLSDVRNRPVRVVEEHQRAVPLSFFTGSKTLRLATLEQTQKACKKLKPVQRNKKRGNRSRKKGRFKSPNHTDHIEVFNILGPEHQPYLYFVFSRAKTEQLAKALKRDLREPLTDQKEEDEIRKHVEAFKQLPGTEIALDRHLEELLCWGIAFHHAGLHVLLKGLVEELYEKKLIKVLYCTGTFALGINMPARTAVFDSLQRYDGIGMIPLPTREFMQMAGRAGRRGLDDFGTVVIRMDLEEFGELEWQIKRYLSSKSEAVHSRFSLSFNSVVNLLHRHSAQTIRQLVERSFLSWHRRQTAQRLEGQRTALEESALSDIKGGLKKKQKRRRQELERLRTKADYVLNETWEEFQERILFLQSYGYLGFDNEFFPGAKALMHFQIQEIFATELFLRGIFEDLTPPVLYGVLCGMVVELPRGVYVSEAKKHRGFVKRIKKVAMSDPVLDAASITGLPVVWEPYMLPIGKAWAEGKSLAEVMLMISSNTDISGTLIGAFRRAKDLATQLRNAWYEQPQQQKMISKLLKSVSRDEVVVVD